MRSLQVRLRRLNHRFDTNSATSLFYFLLLHMSQNIGLAKCAQGLLVRFARKRKNDNLNFAVGLLLYTQREHALANARFREVMHFERLTPRALHLIALSASWERDFEILERIALEAGAVKSIASFVRGLITHVSSPQESIAYFGQVHDLYLTENAQDHNMAKLPEYVKLSMNVSSYDHQWNARSIDDGLLNRGETHRLGAKVPNSKISRIVLMSYTSEYFFSLAEIVITRIRTKHDYAIFLVIVIPNDSTEVNVQELCIQLSRKFGNIYWQIMTSNFDLPTLSSIVRFTYARELFRRNICESILIIDADTSFVKVDPIDVWEGIRDKFDIALLENESLCPWERMSLGFTILNNTNTCMEFLSGFDRYVTRQFLEKRAYWTLDQTAAHMVLSELQRGKHNRPQDEIDVLNLSKVVSLMDFVFTDELIVKRKLRAKATNPEFRTGMDEPLYYD